MSGEKQSKTRSQIRTRMINHNLRLKKTQMSPQAHKMRSRRTAKRSAEQRSRLSKRLPRLITFKLTEFTRSTKFWERSVQKSERPMLQVRHVVLSR